MINLIQPISFFDRIQEQDNYKENSPAPPRFITDNRLIPFQLKPELGGTVTSFRLVGYKYRFDIDLTANPSIFTILQTVELNNYLFKGGEGLVFRRLTNYPDKPPIYSSEPLELCPDYYHYEITFDSGKTYYSEKFYVIGEGLCENERPITLEIQAWNDPFSEVYGFMFDETFKFKAYFNTFIHYQQALITDEFLKDGYERQVLQKRVIQFPYIFETDPLPYSIANGLAVLTLFNNFVVIENGNTYKADSVTVDLQEIEGTSYSKVVFTFSVRDQDLIKNFCK